MQVWGGGLIEISPVEPRIFLQLLETDQLFDTTRNFCILLGDDSDRIYRKPDLIVLGVQPADDIDGILIDILHKRNLIVFLTNISLIDVQKRLPI